MGVSLNREEKTITRTFTHKHTHTHTCAHAHTVQNAVWKPLMTKDKKNDNKKCGLAGAETECNTLSCRTHWARLRVATMHPVTLRVRAMMNHVRDNRISIRVPLLHRIATFHGGKLYENNNVLVGVIRRKNVTIRDEKPACVYEI